MTGGRIQQIAVLFFFGIACCLMGCASSERMARMSGGVMQSYSAPKAHRLRSEKYRQTSDYARGRDLANNHLDVNATLVNLWPFFFRSNQYYSILWPFMDFDPFGMAVRPFYNHEGDDYSILFPLSSWNPAAGDGWVFTCVWDKESLTFFPIASHRLNERKGHRYYTPFYIQKWELNNDPLMWSRLRKKSFLECMLVFSGSKVWKDTSAHPLLDHYSRNISAKQLSEYLSMSRYLGLPVPGKNENTEKWVIEQIKNLPDSQNSWCGFFPLFYREEEPDCTSWFVFPFYWENGRYNSLYSNILGPFLFRQENRSLHSDSLSTPYHLSKETWKLDMWLLLSRFKKFTTYRENQWWKTCRELYHKLEYENTDIRSQAVQELWKKIDPDLKMPEKVTDRVTMLMFLREVLQAKRDTLPLETTYHGGFLPLFVYKFSDTNTFWLIPALITFYDHEKEGQRTNWFCLPLLSFGKYTPTLDKEFFFMPFGYLDTTRKVVKDSREYYNLSIHTNDTTEVSEYQQSEHKDIYALCGLLYHGKDMFLVEKPGIPRGSAEKIRRGMFKVRNEYSSIVSWKEQLAKKKRDSEEEKPAVLPEAGKHEERIRFYQKQIRLERIMQEEKQLAEREKKNAASLAELKRSAADIHFELPDKFWVNETVFHAALKKLYDFTAEVRWHEDYGNGLFYRKELCQNGNYRWHFCHFLAGGEKENDFEKTHILQLFYRYTRQGKQSETLIFPFISMRKNGEDSDFSFMWRLFRIEKKNGKTGGNIFFIPF